MSALYKADSTCDAEKYTVPNPTRVITPLLSIVATDASLDEYVIAPLLKLVGDVEIEKGTSPYVLLAATTNAEDDNPDAPLFTVITTLPLESVKLLLAACVMEIVAVPTPLIRTSDGSRKETTEILSLENVKTFPPLTSVFVDDGVILNDGLP